MDQEGPRVDATRAGRARAGHAGDTRRRTDPDGGSPGSGRHAGRLRRRRRAGRRPRRGIGSAARSSASCRTGRSTTQHALDYDVLSTIAYFSVGADGNGNLEEARRRRHDDDRLGRLDQLEDDLDHQRRPRSTRPASCSRSSVFAWSSSGAGRARRRCSAAPTARAQPRQGRSRRPCATAAPTASTSTSSRSPAATPTSSWRSSGPIRSELNKVAPRLPAHVRHDWAPSATTRSRPRRRRAPPTRSSSWATTTGRRARRPPARSTRCPARLRPRATPSAAYTARVSPSKLILGVPWYGRAWSTASDSAPRERTLSGAKYGYSRRRSNYEQRRRPTSRSTGGAGTRSSRARGSPTAARTAPRPTAA